MSLFYLGLNPRYQWFRWLPAGINVMYSAAGFWDGRRWRRGKWLSQAGRRWLDCGGYTMLNKHGDYPFSIDNYLNLVAHLRPNYYATMDYPCEPDISRNLGLMTNEQRIEATVDNAKKTLARATLVGSGQVVPIIQGYTLDEYCHCLDLHQAARTIRPYMAVGSMCRRIDDDELERLIIGIRQHSYSIGVERLHFFGLKLTPKLDDLSQYIYSRDSAVAYDDYDSELRQARNGRRWPRGQKEKRQSVESFLNRVADLGLNYV